MAWITSAVDTTHLDEDSDLVLNARPAIKQTADNVNIVKDMFAINSITNGQSLRYNSSTGSLEPITLTNTVSGYDKQQYIKQNTLTPSSTVAWDLDTHQAASITLNQNITLSNPTNMKAGATYTLHCVQDATGNRTITFGSAFKFPEGVVPDISVDSNAVDLLVFYCDGTSMLGTIMRNYA
jgi:hypothetical protein